MFLFLRSLGSRFVLILVIYMLLSFFWLDASVDRSGAPPAAVASLDACAAEVAFHLACIL